MVDVRFSRPAMWLTAVTFTLAACGVGAPAPPVQVPVPSTAAEAPTGFDNRSNGTVNDSTHQAIRTPSTRWKKSRTGWNHSTTPRPAASAIKTPPRAQRVRSRSEEHTSELQSQSNLVCRLLLEKKKDQSQCLPCSALWYRPSR